MDKIIKFLEDSGFDAITPDEYINDKCRVVIERNFYSVYFYCAERN